MKTFLLLFCILVSFSLSATSQTRTNTYAIKSLDGISEKVSLTDGESQSETLMITCGDNKLLIHHYWALENVRVLNDCFLEIRYAQRGGSCVGIGYTLLVSVNNGKLIVPFTAMNRLTGCGTEEDDSYTIKYHIIKSKIEQYKMDIYIHDRKTITDAKLGASYDKHWISHLEYNPSHHIFHNGYMKLSGAFLIISGKTIKEYIDGTYPIIGFNGPGLKANVYFYINDNWYEQGEKNYLVKIS